MNICSEKVVVKYLSNVNINVDEVIYIKNYEFKVVKKTTTTDEEGESFSFVLKPNSKPKSCDIELRVKTDNVFVAQDELGFGLDMGDTVQFVKGKIGKQLKIAPTPEDEEKTTPDRIVRKRGRHKKVAA